jgi:protein-tyrosine phosphatase
MMSNNEIIVSLLGERLVNYTNDDYNEIPLAKNDCRLYIGNIHVLRNTNGSILKDLNVSVVVNLCTDKSMEIGNVNYYNFNNIDDTMHPADRLRMANLLPKITTIIHDAISAGKNVYVHCHAGISRSATAVLAYLIRYEQMSLQFAARVVRQVRNIYPANFCNELSEFNRVYGP